ncbi:MAG: hypothetical protein PHF23_07210 [Smithellaceae bacterium]|nr:hypothetical protein [Smithellaceae bacterium]
MITRLKPVLILLILASLLPILALGAPDEASGIVTNVVDGDTFDLRIDKTDPRIIYEIERVRLADVDSPEMRTPEGEPAKVFATDTLLEKRSGWISMISRRTGGTLTAVLSPWSIWRIRMGRLTPPTPSTGFWWMLVMP